MEWIGTSSQTKETSPPTGALFWETDTKNMYRYSGSAWVLDSKNSDSEELVAVASPQFITASWADLGGEIDCRGFNTIALWVALDINDSTDVQLRALPKLAASSATEYQPVIETISASKVEIQAEIVEFTNNADLNVVVSWDTGSVWELLQFQVQAAANGIHASTGQIDSATVTKGFK